MRVLILPKPHHGGDIRSVDINASHTWMATGGADNNVLFWDLKQFTNIASTKVEDLAQIESQHQISAHSAPVTVLRWCPTMDHLLISADTNGHVVLLNVRDSSSREIYPWPGAEDPQSASVIAASWSRDGRLFAWSAADGRVHLFDIERNTHQVLVDIGSSKEKPTVQRGLSFDPTSNLLALLGDDTFVTIYQYQFDNNGSYQFKILSKISKLTSNGTVSYFSHGCRRLSWSCDGEFFAVPIASKQLTSLISLLSRSQGWDNRVNLVGHGMSCDLVKFAPRIFDSGERNPEGPTKAEDGQVLVEDSDVDVYHIVASAGSDNSFVVWNTSKEAPIVVIKDLTSKPLTDIAWNLASDSIIMVSGDGYIIIATFTEGELGYPASEEFLDKLKASQRHTLKAFSVKSEDATSEKKSKGPKQVSEVIEQTNAVDLQLAFSKKKLPVKEDSAEDTFSNESQAKTSNSDAQTVIVGDISPIVLPAEPLKDQNATDALQSAMEDRASTAVETNPKPTKVKSEPKQAKKFSVETQKVTTKDGKKRIQPILISNGNKAPISTERSNLDLTINNGSGDSGPRSLMEFDRPSYLVSEGFQKDIKRVKSQDSNGVTKKAKRALEPVKFIGSVVVNPNTTFSKLRLSIPRVRSTFRLSSRQAELTFLDIRNGEGNENTPSRVTQFKNETQIWTDFIPKYIQLAVEGHDFWAICTSDGQIYVYSHLSGKRLLPPIVLGSPLSFLESHGKYLLAVTSVGEMYVWDMERKKIHLHNSQSVATLLDLNSKYQEDGLSRADSISMCSITVKGTPLVTLSNGSGYLFNVDLDVWQTVSETWWAFGSHYWDSISDDKVAAKQSSLSESDGAKESSIIGLLEHKTNEEIVRKSRLGRGKFFNKISKNMIMKEGFENLENIISLSHMENRILCCELLDEKQDFKDFIITYAKRLSELGLKGKLFELCQDLLGNDETTAAETAEVCGWNKHALLKEIVVDCAEHRDSQRILTYFGQKLGLVDKEY